MRERNISVFNEDIISNNGYLYTNTNKLSCKLSVSRNNQAIHQLLGSIKDKKIIDIGCGDGAFIKEIIDLQPKSIIGIDPSEAAIALAKKTTAQFKQVEFQVMDIYELPLHQRYDIAILQGVLHHLYHPEKAIERVCQIADKLIILEPNGYNPVLKILEKFSSYHIRHEEKSFFPKKLDKFFIKQGGVINKSAYVCLVPMFCPDFLAKILKFIEPWVESIPLFQNISCGGYVQEVHMSKNN